MTRLARYCEARQQACDMISEARAKPAQPHNTTSALSNSNLNYTADSSNRNSEVEDTIPPPKNNVSVSGDGVLSPLSDDSLMMTPLTAADMALVDEATREDEIHATKEQICNMLEACALTKKDFICLRVIGITLDGWDSKERVLRSTINRILTGVYNCRVGDAPLQLQQNVPFHDATDFEANKLVEASLGVVSAEDYSNYYTNNSNSSVLNSTFHTPSNNAGAGGAGLSSHSGRSSLSDVVVHMLPIFGPSRCHVCRKVFDSFTLRRCMRKKFCRLCGNACCVACCSHKVFDVEADHDADICVHCVLAQNKHGPVLPVCNIDLTRNQHDYYFCFEQTESFSASSALHK
jgi:hypothetical protein